MSQPPAAGGYRETSAAAALRGHLRCVWWHDLPAGPPSEVVVLPDGCVDVLWIAGELVLVGPDAVAARPRLAGGARVLGARLMPGVAYRWLGVPMDAVVGCQVPLADLVGAPAREAASRLADAGTPAAAARVFDAALHRLLRAADPVVDEAAWIFAAAGAGSGGPLVPRLTRALGLSERTLRRRSRDWFGYGPKTLERILRLQRLLALASAPGPQDAAGLAASAGYADQSHLNREVRALCGMSAASLLARRGRFVQDDG